MTAPAITVGPEATIRAAGHLMTAHRVRRLPVTGADDTLIGIVTRRDLLRVFLRPDGDIIADARRVIDRLPVADPGTVIVAARHGVVTLTGTAAPVAGQYHDVLRLASRMLQDIDGIVDVVNRLSVRLGTDGPDDR
jgi:CBS domain-containing protein